MLNSNSENGVGSGITVGTGITGGCSKILRASSFFPMGQSASDLFATFPSYRSRVAEQRARMLNLLRSLVDKIESEGGEAVCSILEKELKEWNGEVSDVNQFDAEGRTQQVNRSKKRPYSVVSGTEDSMRPLFDVVDRLREATEACIDEARGEAAAQQVALVNKSLAQSGSQPNNFSSTSRGNRPQAQFVPPVDNSRASALGPSRLHPHQQVIENLVLSELQTGKASPPQFFFKLNDVECDFIETREKLDEMLLHLENVSEIAMDLEAHSLRSFQGFTCLIQISSRTRDFLVDALKLRPYLGALNRVTTNPSILKVLHGCDSDIIWLQRDFNVFLVNVFDTGQAARILAYPSFGLAYLLQKFANVTAQKQYQMADWRQRPIPQALLKYAREDTHYLLGIYDRMKNELIENSSTSSMIKVGDLQSTSNMVEVPSLLHQVISRSNEITLKVYQLEKFRPFAYRRLLGKLGGSESLAISHIQAAESNDGGLHPAVDPSLTPRSRVFAALFDWRDAVAREEDESTHYVLPNQLLHRIADVIPVSIEALVRCCSPPPSCVRARLFELISIITAARDCKISAPLSASIAFTNADAKISLVSQQKSVSIAPPLIREGNKPVFMDASTGLPLLVAHINSGTPEESKSDFYGVGLQKPGRGWLQAPVLSVNPVPLQSSISKPSELFSCLSRMSLLSKMGSNLRGVSPVKSCLDVLGVVLASRPRANFTESKAGKLKEDKEEEKAGDEPQPKLPESLSQRFFASNIDRKADPPLNTSAIAKPSTTPFDYAKLKDSVIISSTKLPEKRNEGREKASTKRFGKGGKKTNPYTK
jgi:ribonuclease D